MIKLNIEELLKKNSKSKYWLCQNMNVTSRNMNRIIRGETSSISFKYFQSSSKFVINNISLNIPINKTTAIVGQSGSGKTSLIKCIYGLVDLIDGEIKDRKSVV